MIYKVAVFPSLKCVYPMQPADQAHQTPKFQESWNLGTNFQSSSTSSNQIHMSVGVLFRGETKHSKILFSTAHSIEIHGLSQDKPDYNATVC